MKGMQRKSEEKERGSILQSGDPLQILAAMFFGSFSHVSTHLLSVSVRDRQVNEQERETTRPGLEGKFQFIKT